jgi:hypothetical protein
MGIKMRKKIVLAKFLLMVCVFIVHAQQYDPESDFEVKVIQGGREIEITGYLGAKQEVRIPLRIKNLPVTIIGDSAFMDKDLNNVTIPNTVYQIDSDVFEDNELTSITMPASLIEIGSNAFANNKLTSVNLPNGLTKIGQNAFRNNRLTNITIPDTVTTLGDGAFERNQLASVTIGRGIRTIEITAFAENKLTSVTIPPNVTSIKNSAFKDNLLTSITIGANVNIASGSPSFSGNPTDSSFDHNFPDFYNNNNRKAGTYTTSLTVTVTSDPTIEMFRALGMKIETEDEDETTITASGWSFR